MRSLIAALLEKAVLSVEGAVLTSATDGESDGVAAGVGSGEEGVQDESARSVTAQISKQSGMTRKLRFFIICTLPFFSLNLTNIKKIPQIYANVKQILTTFLA
ncbi:MAG: hypothetical protein LBI19_09955 [Oscillospiraceae bacterium]|nr:hypothetical protein [Oscillospiraceae bacterium]